MSWRYDNSLRNPRNPNEPPRTARYGLQSTDEMAELWLQVLPVRTNDLAALARYDQPRVFRDAIDFNQYLLALDPRDARAHNEIGKAKLFLGKFAEAASSLRRAASLDATLDEPHYFLGLSSRMQNQLQDAVLEFTEATRLNPANAKAHGNLGLVLMETGNLKEAEAHLRAALRLNPQDTIARETLEEIAQSREAAPQKK
jgi:superkiller protein 3